MEPRGWAPPSEPIFCLCQTVKTSYCGGVETRGLEPSLALFAAHGPLSLNLTKEAHAQSGLVAFDPVPSKRAGDEGLQCARIAKGTKGVG